MNNVSFTKLALKQFDEWVKINPRIAAKILKLIKDCLRNPYTGIGHPERLRYELNEYWSRQINEEHRLVYQVVDDTLVIISCKYHYNK
jgi:toxin YoeB